MNKICIITVYFGQLPNHFGLWLKSCTFNPTVDFMIVSDQSVSHLPTNIKLVEHTLDSFRTLAEAQLGMEVALNQPYKCCDLKPVYGVILNEHLKQYDYWGHCDIDLVFGDLEYYFKRYNLYQYDKFLPLGHLSLYRNTEENNNRYKLSGSLVGEFNDVFSDESNRIFDELRGIYQIYLVHDFPMFTQRIFADLSSYNRRIRLVNRDPDYHYEIFYWENGQALRKYWDGQTIQSDSFMYTHFQKRKFTFEISDLEKVNSFAILSDRMVELKTPIETKEQLQELNPYYGPLLEWFEYSIYIINEKFHGRLEKIKKYFSHN